MARNGLAHPEPYLDWDGRYMRFNGDFVHRLLWKSYFGEVPNGYCVHHINGNKLDNRIENLELISRADHCKLHLPRLGYRGPIATKCDVCGQPRSDKAIAHEPHRHICYKCKARQNRARRKVLA